MYNMQLKFPGRTRFTGATAVVVDNLGWELASVPRSLVSEGLRCHSGKGRLDLFS